MHGVADQNPGDSTSAIAALLLNLAQTQDRSWLYAPFQARALQIPMAPAVAEGVRHDFDFALALEENEQRDLERARPANPLTRLWRRLADAVSSAFRESRPGYRETLDQGSHSRKAKRILERGEPEPLTGEHLVGDEDAGLTFMRSLLGNYQGDIGPRAYATTRLEGGRRETMEARQIDVDVYEMYWADLSRAGTGPIRVFSSLYQLVLHVSELGRRALEDAVSEFADDVRWKRLLRFQEAAVRLLTVPIPLLNLMILVTLVNGGLARVVGGKVDAPNDFALRIASVLGAVVITVTGAYLFASSKLRPSMRGWWLIPIISVFIGAGLGYVLIIISLGHPAVVFTAECWLASLALIDLLHKKYEKVRPGALVTGRIIAFGTAAFFAVALGVAFVSMGATHERGVEYASLWTVQLLNILLSVALVALFVFALLAAVLGHSIVSDLKDAPCARARAAVRTSRLALGISASTMLGVVTIFWSGLLAWASSNIGAFECMEPSMFPAFRGLGWLAAQPEVMARWLSVPPAAVCTGVTNDVFGYFSAVLLMGTTTGLPVNMVLVSLSLMLLVWMALPSVTFEGDAPTSCTNADSRHAGQWLSRGLDATKIVTHLWWAAVFIVATVFGIGDVFAREGRPVAFLDWSKDWAAPILSAAGTLVAAFAAAIIFGIAKFGGSALDVLLDVDNYLRERPLEGTPRARIAERFASLLRYLAHDRSKNDRPYHAIVIVAHSLGALLTADLLRYFRSETRLGRGDPELAPLGYGRTEQPGTIPIHLFTMGNPLRQLLSRFFPHQYRWVRSKPDNSMKPVGDPTADPAMPDVPQPSPRTLGVATWTNAYRSGDYVGRSLWLDEWFARTKGGDNEGRYPEPIEVFRRDDAAEMCLGLGAHTHYWDNTAPDIRDQLDQLVVSACAQKP